MNQTAFTFAGVLALTLLPARADTFGSGANTFTIDFVNIGNAGNADDAGAGGGIYSSPYGGVPYVYRIGVSEVPNDWVNKAEHLGMTFVANTAWAGTQQPAAFMKWHEAAVFVNWLNTSTGHQAPYSMSFNPFGGGWSLNLRTSAQAWQLGGENLYRHKDAYYFLPSEDEWYKAAYHKNDGVTANYWDYPTGSNSIPAAVASGTGADTAVYRSASSSPAAVDDDGGLSSYGTRGQGGNVWEFTESAYDGSNNIPGEGRATRGGMIVTGEDSLRSSSRTNELPASFSVFVGFRVASVIPEPSSAVLLLGAGLAVVGRRSRNAGR